MNMILTVLILICAAAASFVFATLAFSLRDYSRATLADWFDRRWRKRNPGKAAQAKSVDGERYVLPPEAATRLEAVVENEDELSLTAAAARAAANLVVVLAILHLILQIESDLVGWPAYLIAFAISFVVVGLVSVALPIAVSSHAAEPFIGVFSGLLRLKRLAFWPFVQVHAPIDRFVRRAAGRREETPEHVEEEIEKEILDIVNEGRSEGVIDESERQMIERALRFQDMTAEQAMTPRGDIVALAHDATADDVLAMIDESGYSRIPVYSENIDRIVGVLYARDLFRYVGKRLNGHNSNVGGLETRRFDLTEIVRKPLIVPESKPLSDLLRDMQLQKIHMAIVLDEYNGTSGLVTIEDILEELVGEIADEHETDVDPPFERLADTAAEADARIEIGEFNRLMGLSLPAGEGFDTLGGFVMTQLGRIPTAGTTFEYDSHGTHATFTVLAAEPQRVNRVRIDLLPTEETVAPPPEPVLAEVTTEVTSRTSSDTN